jgi:hypothetical protein
MLKSAKTTKEASAKSIGKSAYFFIKLIILIRLLLPKLKILILPLVN